MSDDRSTRTSSAVPHGNTSVIARADTAEPSLPPPAPDRRRRTVRRRTIAVALAVLLVAPAVSYGRALTYPGSATFQMRTVEWIRDHGGNPLVDRIENWWYTLNSPTGAAPDPAALPVNRAGAVAGAPTSWPLPAPAPLARLARPSTVPGEGTWVPGRLDPAGAPAVFTTFVRPDPKHPSVVAGVAWIRAGDTRARLVPGTVEPGGTGWPGGARVGPGDVRALVATFNSGWKMKGARGGFYLQGRAVGRLRTGQASLVIDDTGAATVGSWGRDVTMSPRVVAVRQNLALIVDNGRPAVGLTANSGQRWGNTKNQYQYTWRSAVGVDAAGNLIYVGGVNLTLQALATALTDARAVRGMELDIHSAMVSFASWAPAAAGTPVPTKLLPNMSRSADRYLSADERDFFYLTLR